MGGKAAICGLLCALFCLNSARGATAFDQISTATGPHSALDTTAVDQVSTAGGRTSTTNGQIATTGEQTAAASSQAAASTQPDSSQDAAHDQTAAASGAALTTSARSAVLMDADSGRVLYAQDMDTPRSIASITKLMTALVCAESFDDLDQTLLIAPEAVGVEGSSLYLKPYEEYTVRQLLYGLLLRSGNDAAAALAIGCSGDEATFVAAMNHKARALGMTNTHFENPHGLEAEGHVSSAYDMARLARAVLQNPALAEMCATKSYTFGGQTITNHNKLLWQYDGCIGFKTGYTKAAGRTLVSGATREGGTLIAVTLNDGNDWQDHAALLDYGFETYEPHLLARGGKVLALLPVRGSVLGAVPVVVQDDVRGMLAEEETVTVRIQLPDHAEAPIAAGGVLGSLTFFCGGEEIGKTNLVAAGEVPCGTRTGIFETLCRRSPMYEAAAACAPRWRGMLTALNSPEGG